MENFHECKYLGILKTAHSEGNSVGREGRPLSGFRNETLGKWRCWFTEVGNELRRKLRRVVWEELRVAGTGRRSLVCSWLFEAGAQKRESWVGHRHSGEMTSDRKQGLGKALELREASRKHREGTVEERDRSGRAQCQDGQDSISMQSRWYVQRLTEEAMEALTDAKGEEG